jgi:hypothetical protein
MVDRLIPTVERNARQRLESFIQDARTNLAAFGSNLIWNEAAWDVIGACPIPASKSRKSAVIYFTTHDNGTSKGVAQRIPLSEPFASFIKALIRRKFDARAITFDPLARIVNASRDLHEALRDDGYDPVNLLPTHFDQTANAIVARAGASTAYGLGNALQEIAATIDRHSLSKTRLDWENPIPKAGNSQSRLRPDTPDDGDKLPPPYVLDQIAELSHLVTDPSDVIIMGCIKLLHCAPWRIGEVLMLATDCEVHEPKIGPSGPVLNEDGAPVMRYGLRYWKEKSPDPDIKWIPSVMVDTARDAIAQIRAHTSEATKLARWMEAHPGRARLPGPDLGTDQTFTRVEIAEMLNLYSKDAAGLWLANRKVAEIKAAPRYLVLRRDLEQALLEDCVVPPTTRGISKLSQMLFLTLKNLHGSNRGTNPCSLGLTTMQHVSDFLSGRRSIRGETQSVFARFGRTMPDGSSIEITSHQFRHWLNTLAQAGGLDQTLIARWSGRDDMRQNEAYDHVSAIELAAKARQLMEDDQFKGALADLHKSKPPRDRAKLRETLLATAHVTEIGMCDLDWITSACPEFNACATCEHCLITKGDHEAKARTEKLRADTAWLLERSVVEVNDGTIGASNHVKAQETMLSALNKIIAIHEDDDIPDGTLVQPVTVSPAHFTGPSLPEVR